MDTIPCGVCTFLNSPKNKKCEICGEDLLYLVPDAKHDQFENDVTFLHEKWPCAACTFLNDVTSKSCVVCSEPTPITTSKKMKRYEDNKNTKSFVPPNFAN